MTDKELVEKLDSFLNSLSEFSEKHEAMTKEMIRLTEVGEELYVEAYERKLRSV